MRTDGEIRLRADFQARPEGGLRVRATVENSSRGRIFVYSGLWRLRANRFEVEPEPAYRRLTGDQHLEILVGNPPLPRSKTPIFRIDPEVVAVDAGTVLPIDMTLDDGIKEYNPYFPEMASSGYQTVTVRTAELLVDYLSDHPGVETRPSAILPGYLKIVTPAARVHLQTLSSGWMPVQINVQKRTDEFERE